MFKEIRKLIVEAAYTAKHGHIPSALSIVELIIAVHELKKDQDVFILSKGHGCLAYYSYLVLQNSISKKDLLQFGKRGSKLGGHPDKNKVDEIYASTGSLGHGFPIAIGSALAKKLNKQDNNVYCIIGDGESNEGTIWESLAIASKLNLNNLYCIVDNNCSQIRSLPAENLYEKFKSFGWEVIIVDGHDINLIKQALITKSNKPIAIIANTIKGKGIAAIESAMFEWHHRAPTEEEFNNFIKEINES